uniref:Uncharacterized protein n=1 Tax=Varanus komodoensis TaxID=61221 RepID=A0A8D2LSU4_VARKO
MLNRQSLDVHRIFQSPSCEVKKGPASIEQLLLVTSLLCFHFSLYSMYGELALCIGLLAEGMGCPVSSPILDAFFMRIHAEYFANCSLPIHTTDLQPSTGTVIILTSLSVCLVPLFVALTLWKAWRPENEP